MARWTLWTVVLAAVLTAGCGSSDGSGSPAGPSPSPAPSTPAPTPPAAASCPPAAPRNLQVVRVDSTRTFTWGAVSNAYDYFIQIGTASGRADLINTNTTQTTYTWTGASPGTYYARVHARATCGSSPNSNEIVFN